MTDSDYADWQLEVANGDTVRGYSEWCEAKAEADRFCSRAPRTDVTDMIPDQAVFLAYSGDAGEAWAAEFERMMHAGYNGVITVRSDDGADSTYPFHPLEVALDIGDERYRGACFVVRGLAYDAAGAAPGEDPDVLCGMVPQEMWDADGLEGLADALACPGVSLVEYPVGYGNGHSYVVGFYAY